MTQIRPLTLQVKWQKTWTRSKMALVRKWVCWWGLSQHFWDPSFTHSHKTGWSLWSYHLYFLSWLCSGVWWEPSWHESQRWNFWLHARHMENKKLFSIKGWNEHIWKSRCHSPGGAFFNKNSDSIWGPEERIWPLRNWGQNCQKERDIQVNLIFCLYRIGIAFLLTIPFPITL